MKLDLHSVRGLYNTCMSLSLVVSTLPSCAHLKTLFSHDNYILCIMHHVM